MSDNTNRGQLRRQEAAIERELERRKLGPSERQALSLSGKLSKLRRETTEDHDRT